MLNFENSCGSKTGPYRTVDFLHPFSFVVIMESIPVNYWKKTKLNVVLQRLYLLGAPKAGFFKAGLISCVANQPTKIELLGVRDNVVYIMSISRILSNYQYTINHPFWKVLMACVILLFLNDSVSVFDEAWYKIPTV